MNESPRFPRQTLAFCALLLGAFSPAFGADTAQVPWTESTWGKVTSFRFKDTVTQPEFEKFCKDHPDAVDLSLSCCTKLTSLAPLSGLTKVTKLDIGSLNCRDGHTETPRRYDLRALSGMKNLEDLYCGGTRVKNIEALKGLSKLKKCSFSFLEENLDGLPESIEELGLQGPSQKFKDYAPLARMKLKSLDVYQNPQATAKNLSVLKGMKSLEKFEAYCTKTEDIGFLTDCPNLRRVNLGLTPITDLSPLSGKPKLKEVFLDRTRIKTLDALSGCMELDFLIISGTEITDISLLADKAKLNHLDLSITKIADLAPLKNCAALHVLQLLRTPVTDITPILGLKKLSSVSLSGGIPAEQIEALKAANPNVSVHIDKPKTR